MEWLARTRLLEELKHATQRTITLIAAPAEYGKTTRCHAVAGFAVSARKYRVDIA
jgi:ATP/maltotriose-dependent transcriptional regulator MalT